MSHNATTSASAPPRAESKKKSQKQYEYLNELFGQVFTPSTGGKKNNNNHSHQSSSSSSPATIDDSLLDTLTHNKQRLEMTDMETNIMNQITGEMSRLFHREMRRLIPIEIPLITENYLATTLELANQNREQLELDTSLFREGYLVFSEPPKSSTAEKQEDAEKKKKDKNHHQALLITLNESLIREKAVNPILSDASAYVDREGVLNHIEKRMTAPRQQIVRFGHEDEFDRLNEKKLKQEQIEFEKQYELEQFQSERTRKSSKKSAGAGWFNMEAPELTEEMRQELIALRLKHATSGAANQKTRDNRLPSRDGSAEDSLPQFFQIGTIQEGAHEFYSDRMNKRDRQQSFLDELLKDEAETGYVANRYAELQTNLTKEQRNKKKRVEKRFKKNDKVGGAKKKQKTK